MFLILLLASFPRLASPVPFLDILNNEPKNDVARADPIRDICTKCCQPGPTQHGNEKCGLALDSHSFAFDLIRLLGSRDENIVVSPFSVMNILMLLSLGSRSRTRYQIRSALHFPLYFRTDEDHFMMKCALDKYDGISLRTSIAMFYDKERVVARQHFLTRAASFYNLTAHGISFNDPFAAWQSIGQFLRENTNGMLDNVLQETAISDLILVNTVYFNGSWQFEVPPGSTRSFFFSSSYMTRKLVKGFQVETELNCALLADFKFYGANIRIVELPYTDDQFALYLFKAESGHLSLNFIEDVIESWTLREILRWHMSKSPMHLTIPKFTISFQAEISKALEMMGVKDLFEAGNKRADLSNMVSNKNGDPIKADGLVHSAKISVTEAGTEAAAGSYTSIKREHAEPERVTFDRPFVFILYDKCNNLILFQGRCSDPD